MPRITISQYSFDISAPFYEGQEMSESVANILNYHRADLIRKIIVKWVEVLEKEAPDGVLTIEVLDDLISRIGEFDRTYEMSTREPAKLSTFDREVQAVAFEKAKDENSNAKFLAKVQVLLQDPEVRNEARDRLIDKAKHIGKLEDILA